MLEFAQRLGELLIRDGIVNSDQLERGLATQVIHGGRIGTNLVESGYLEIEKLGWALGQLHSVPVADRQTFESVSPKTRAIVPTTVCTQYKVFPLRYEQSQIHLAMLDPHKLDLIDQVGAILGISTIHPYAVPELRLHHLLEVHYQVPRPKRFLREPGKAIANERRRYLKPTLKPNQPPPVVPSRSRASQDVLQMVFGPETLRDDGLRTSAKVPADAQAAPETHDIIISLEGFEQPVEAPPSLDQLIASIDNTSDRETLIDLLQHPILPEADLSVLFMLRGDMALALGATGTDLSKDVIRTLVVPLSISGMFQRALSTGQPIRRKAEGDPTQRMIAAYLGKPTPTEVCLVPIGINDQPANVICLQTTTGFKDDALTQLSRLGGAVAGCYRRLLQRDTAEINPVPAQKTATISTDPTPESGSSLSLVSVFDEPGSGSLPGAPEPIDEVGSRLAQEITLLPRSQRPFGRYTLICRLASGGMANLYLARLSGRRGFAKELAIKRIHEHLGRQEEFIRMFIDEARLVARVAHPNVVQVVEFDCIDEAFYIAMEYVHGESLHALMNQTRPKPALSARIVANAAAGLHAAHELCDSQGQLLNVVHRDVSPQNILISYQGAVKVVDFGVARARGNIQTTTVGTVKGKLAYMSPEQVKSQPLDRRADVFSLGIVLYETTTHRRLFKGRTEQDTMIRVVKGEVTPPSKVRPDYPAELETIVMTALERNPALRYQTAEELQEALEEFIVKSESVMLASALGKLMRRTFKAQIAEKRGVVEAFERETS